MAILSRNARGQTLRHFGLVKSAVVATSIFFVTIGNAVAQSGELEGEQTTSTITREGKRIDGNDRLAGTLRSNIYRSFIQRTWGMADMPVARCRTVSGRGDGDWKGFWDTNNFEERVDRLNRAIAGLGERGAMQIVQDGFLTRKPRSWDDFAAEIRRADNQPDSLGYSRRVLGQFADQNRRALGYVDREPEIGGNGDWKGYWDASRSERPSRLSRAVEGLTLQDAASLVRFGAFSTVPRNWEEFADTIIRADINMNSGFSYEVLIRNGRENMRSLGYFDREACNEASRSVNVLRAERARRLERVAERRFEILIRDGVLLAGERETFDLTFDGFRDSLNANSRFNSYRTTRQEDSSGVVVYSLQASRKAVRPTNSVTATVSNDGGMAVVEFVDKAYDAEMNDLMGDVVVKAEVYESRFLFDRKLGTFETRLTPDGRPVRVPTNVRPRSDSRVYVYYWIQRRGSRFFNDEDSSTLQSEKVRF